MLTVSNSVFESVDWFQQALDFVWILELLILSISWHVLVADQAPKDTEVARLQQSTNVHNTLQLLKRIITNCYCLKYRRAGTVSINQVFGQSVVVTRKDHHRLQQNVTSKLFVVTKESF